MVLIQVGKMIPPLYVALAIQWHLNSIGILEQSDPQFEICHGNFIGILLNLYSALLSIILLYY